MASHFPFIIGPVLEHEGGFVNHPSDPGGATNWGVSLRALQKFGFLGDIDGDGDVDVADIRAMTQADAVRIYRAAFYPAWLDRITSRDVAGKVFDISVNAGERQAGRILQRAANSMGTTTLVVDGIVGTKTLTAINQLPARSLREALRKEQAAFYQRLVSSNPALSVFLRGWLRRAAF